MKKLYSTILAILAIATTAMAQTTYTEVYTATIKQEVEISNEATAIEIDATAIEAAIGCTLAEATIVNKTGENEYTDAHTSNTAFWYNTESKVCTWGSEGFAFYFEYGEGSSIDFGVNINEVEAGDVFTPNLGFANGDKVALISFELTMKDAPKIDYTVVSTITVNQDVDAEPNYTEQTITFDGDAVATALGCSLAEATLVGVVTEEPMDFTKMYTANNGFWYNASGEICNWGVEGFSYYFEYRVPGSNDFTFAFSDAAIIEDGQVFKTKLGFAYEEKVVILDINLTAIEPEVPDFVVEYTGNVSLTADANNEYTTTPVEIDTEAICAAIGCAMDEAGIVAQNSDGEFVVTPNADGIGFWYNGDGDVQNWGEGCTMFIQYRGNLADADEDDANHLYVGQYPEGCKPGESYDATFGFKFENKVALVKVTLTINGEKEGVDEVIANDNSNNRIYNLQGIEVKAEKNNLPAGLYIIGGKKVLIKK